MDALFFLLVIAGLMIILFIFGIIGESRNRKAYYNNINSLYGKKSSYRFSAREKEHIGSYLTHHRCPGQIDNITWNDLQMDAVFEQMNYTGSRIGSEYLYYLLHTPQKDNDISKKSEYYMQHEKERNSLMLQFHDFGKSTGSPVNDFLDRLDNAKPFSALPYIMMDVILACSIIFMVYVPSWGLLVLMGVIILNMIMYFSRKHLTDPYINGFSYVLKMLRASAVISKGTSGAFENEISKLQKINDSMRSFSAGSFLLMNSSSSNPFDIILDYVRMILGIDMIKFGQMLKKAKACKREIDRLSSILGYMDSVLSISFYRSFLNANGKYCVPEFSETEELNGTERLFTDIKDAYDPLIKNPVCNSISTSKSVLITGSNASGKSTFLKTVSLCVLMAETIGICTASSYRAPYFRIVSAMSTTDDITTGNSYYISEIKAIHRMIDEVKKADTDTPVICFIDEILRGTNTVERIAASAQILKFFGESRSLCFAATHDIELTKMLDGIYDNKHFREEIKDGVITFPYLIFDGKAESRNAIKLLDAMGYDRYIVEQAERSAEDFIKEGEWHI